MGSESIRQVIASLGAKVKPFASCIDPSFSIRNLRSVENGLHNVI